MSRAVKSLMLAAMAAGLLASGAEAAESGFTVVPTTWRLEEYSDGTIAAYFTPSQCASGKIVILPSASNEMKNRFWSLVVTAKIAKKPIGIFYDTTTCAVTHYFLAEEPA